MRTTQYYTKITFYSILYERHIQIEGLGARKKLWSDGLLHSGSKPIIMYIHGSTVKYKCTSLSVVVVLCCLGCLPA